MSSIYHILDKVPGIYEDQMQQEYEDLAQELVKSGRLRIDTDYTSNFARFSEPSLNTTAMFSKEELTESSLIPITKKYLTNLYSKTFSSIALENKVNSVFSDLNKQINKLSPVNPRVALKLARLLVQSAHPIVIKWLLHDRVEVFITYSHNIGDMMDIESWQHSGSNSGMQSTDGKNVAVFVSCGGDPLAHNNEDHPTQGDGWAAVARMQIIAAQELGHFSDIVRDEHGKQITRHSANFSATKATKNVKIGRRQDIENCNKLLKNLLAAGLEKQLTAEKELKFYHQNKIWGIRVVWSWLFAKFYKYKVLSYADRNKLYFVKKFAGEKYMAIMIKVMIDDMKFNLSPVADVYKRDDKEAEEAIACVEALARVPQQVMKWGYITTMATMSNLYKIYYVQVIPSLINSYTAMTGTNYIRNYAPTKKSIGYYLSKINPFKAKRHVFVPVRDV